MKISLKHTKKDLLKEKALILIHQLGFKAMTMRNLADEMDCDVANIYNYIHSKQGLLSTLLMEISNLFLTGVENINLSKSSFEIKARQLVSLYVRLANEYPYQVSLLINEWRNLEKDSLQSFLSEKKQVEKLIQQIVEQGICEGTVITSNPAWTLEHILSSLRWTFNLFTQENQNINVIDLENHIFYLITKGLSR